MSNVIYFCCILCSFLLVSVTDCLFVCAVGIDFKIKTIELGGKRIKLQIWWVRVFNLLHACTLLPDLSCYLSWLWLGFWVKFVTRIVWQPSANICSYPLLTAQANIDFWPFGLKIGIGYTPATLSLQNITPNLFFLSTAQQEGAGILCRAYVRLTFQWSCDQPYHHHQAHAPSWSVAVFTRCFQCSWSWAYF